MKPLANSPMRHLVLATGLILCRFSGFCPASEIESGTRPVDFERHVVGLLGKLGCNAGACHGSFQGKGGLFLSLFSYAPEKDYKSLVKDAFGRRIDTLAPSSSLLLLKATGQVPHGGGQRLKPDSEAYAALLAWISQGAKRVPDSGSLGKLILTPDGGQLEPGQSVKLRLIAEFSDGSREDVTHLTDFKAQDEGILEVTGEGTVRARRPGSTAVVASYLGDVVTGAFHMPYDPAEPPDSQNVTKSDHPIDRIIDADLARMNLVPSAAVDDMTFLRRITLDTIGRLPTVGEQEEFLSDDSADKRERKIDGLLAHPLHASLWATKLSDWTLNSLVTMENRQDTYRNMRPKWSRMWWDWLRVRVAENKPYDQIVRQLLTATSRDDQSPEAWFDNWRKLNDKAANSFDSDYAAKPTNDLFWRRQGFNKEQTIELIASSFLGLQIQCAQCHKHPFDRWTQADYRAFENIVMPVRFDSNEPDARAMLKQEADGRREKEPDELKKRQIQPHRGVYVQKAKQGNYLRHPDTNAPLPLRPPGGPDLLPAARQMPSDDFRDELADWMAKPENPYFAANFANRVWAHYFGVGIVNPVDNFAVGNPPSNPVLLKALAAKFVELKFDIRAFEKFVLTSAAYSRSSVPSVNNSDDDRHFSRYIPHPLMAEIAADVVADAIAWKADPRTMPDIAPGSRAIEVPGNQVTQRDLAFQFRIFGRPPRSVSCECERAADPALPQSLFMAGDEFVVKGIAQSPWMNWAKDYEWPDEDLVEQAFRRLLAREPSEEERAVSLARLQGKSGKERADALADVLWALMNTREFLLNY
ncbi:DUF1549 domain-containing protein [bacterium]|nr:DUF1549 domain-containing protein [bacterium]